MSSRVEKQPPHISQGMNTFEGAALSSASGTNRKRRSSINPLSQLRAGFLNIHRTINLPCVPSGMTSNHTQAQALYYSRPPVLFQSISSLDLHLFALLYLHTHSITVNGP